MKLLNLNIGLKLDNTNDVIKLINSNNYDLITLQEATRRIDNKALDKYDSSNKIKKEIDYPYSFFAPLWLGEAYRNKTGIAVDFKGTIEQGNETLSKYPFLSCRNHFYHKDYGTICDIEIFRKEDHGRAYLETIININGKKLQIINIHGIWNKDKLGDERTIKQSNSILDAIRYDMPSIVVGDFNLLPDTKSIELIDDKMTNLIKKYNIRTTRPQFKDELDHGKIVCDYIFVNNLVKINDFKVLDVNVSDHLPLILDFDI